MSHGPREAEAEPNVLVGGMPTEEDDDVILMDSNNNTLDSNSTDNLSLIHISEPTRPY